MLNYKLDDKLDLSYLFATLNGFKCANVLLINGNLFKIVQVYRSKTDWDYT